MTDIDQLFPEDGRSKKEVFKEIEEAEGDNMAFSDGRVLGSMCSSPLDIGREVYSMFLESNLGNPGLYKGTARLNKKVQRAVGSLLHAPEDCCSISVGGATEGNIIALWRARNKSGKRKVLLPESAHFSFKKACDLLDMEAVYIPLDENYLPDLSIMEDEIDNETAAVVGIAGTTELGLIEPIEEMAEMTGDIHFHVDAAFGGMVIPFLNDLGHDLPPFDLGIDGVDTLAVDPHKMGLSPVPLGLFYSREESSISVESPYLTGRSQNSIRGTRASASIPAFWATFNHLGKEGYRREVAKCMENTYYLVDRMEEIGIEPVVEPVMNIASFHHEDPEKVLLELEKRGWNISRTVKPPGLRFVVMPHVKVESIDEVVDMIGELDL